MGACVSKEPVYLTSPNKKNNLQSAIKDTQVEFKNGIHDLKENISEGIDELKEDISGALDNIHGSLSEYADDIQEGVEDGIVHVRQGIVDASLFLSAFIKRSFGVILSKIPKNQLRASEYYKKHKNIAGTFIMPKRLDMRKDLLDVRDQGQIGSCVAQACAAMKEYQEFIETGAKNQYSVQFIYDHRENRNLRGMTEGMTGYDAMTILTKRGVCFEKNYPYGRSMNVKDISKQIYQEAIRYKIQTFIFIDTIDGMKQALIDKGPCLIIVPVYDSISTVRFWAPSPKQKTITGYHAIAVVGYIDDAVDGNNGFIIRNSWSKRWGDNGYAVMLYKDWKKDECPVEAWAAVDEVNGK